MSDQLHADSRNITACFTGHRQLPASELSALVVRLDAVLEALWQRGYRRFICGGALGFDTVAAERVVSMQLLHPDVRLIMALPCGDQTKSWRTEDCRRYERMLYTADETHVLSPVYYAGCMMVRNRYMVDHASFCVCYLNKMKGGTVSTVAYAMQEKISLLNLAMEDACRMFVQSEKEGAQKKAQEGPEGP